MPLPRPSLLSDQDRAFIDAHPVARLATADAQGMPHVLPICCVVLTETLYLTIDQKPKSGDVRRLKRLRNIAENPQVAAIIDRYDEDWTQLGWIMLRGKAEIIHAGEEHDRAQEALRKRYPPYRDMKLDDLPVIAVRIEHVTRWGTLAA